nr:putative ribonuclease H-like domain-containing protein [Tanacetum cinerariifolium]
MRNLIKILIGMLLLIMFNPRSLSKFDGNVDERFLVGYSISSKAFRVFNSRTRIVQETLHVNFLENKPNVAGSGPTWTFDTDTLTKTINYQPVTAGNQSNSSAGVQEQFDTGKAGEKIEQQYVLFPVWTDYDVSKLLKSVSAPTSSSSSEEVMSSNSGISRSSKRAIGTKWVFRNKKDERGIVFRNKARLIAQGHTQEEGIDYEVFAPVVRIEAIRLFLAYTSFMGFMVYQMDVKSAFLYETIEEEVYVCQPPGFEDPDHPDKVYKVVKALYGLHQAPRA